MEIHPREKIVNNSRIALIECLAKWRTDHDFLTSNELISVLLGETYDFISSTLKYAIREERHGDVNKPGGLNG